MVSLVTLAPFQPQEAVTVSDASCTLDLTLTLRHVFKLLASMRQTA